MKPMKKRESFKHMKQADRDRIQCLLRRGHRQAEIAAIVGFDKSAISREIRGRSKRTGAYDALNAQLKAANKRRHAKYQGMKIEADDSLREYIVDKLRAGQSPDAISGRMKYEKTAFFASKNAIYQWLYSADGQRYCNLLCTKRFRPRKRKEARVKRQMIPHRISFRDITTPIRSEADQAVSSLNTAAIAVVIIRTSKLLMVRKVPNHTPRSMTHAIRRMDACTPLGQTIVDNGIENKHHLSWGVPTCFADPHAPWQKPLVEQSIGLMRRWFYPKKKTDWKKVSSWELRAAVRVINNKYRKSLGYMSAYEVEYGRDSIKKNDRTETVGCCI
jgi:IS30 family transposase